MAIPSYPSNIPNVIMNDYGFQPMKAFIRTEMETGLARTRRRFVSAPTDINVRWEFTQAELGVFENFFDDELYNGTGWFNVNLVNGFGQQAYVARFKEPYNAKTSAKEFMWSVSATLEVVARPHMTTALAALFERTTQNGSIVLTPVNPVTTISTAMTADKPISLAGNEYLSFGVNGSLNLSELILVATPRASVGDPSVGMQYLFLDENYILVLKDSDGNITELAFVS